MIVSFQLYTDSQGLGAEKCRLADEKEEVASGPPASPSPPSASSQLKAKPKGSSVVADKESMVLKAKPKASAAAGADAGAASVLKAKPKMSAGSGRPVGSGGTLTI